MLALAVSAQATQNVRDMPLTGIRLHGFKCFEDSGSIPIAPLTLIFGRNNAGKSSVLQSLLVLRQTLDAPENGPRLNLRGPLYRAGTYADIVHQHRSKTHVKFEFDVSFGKSKRTSEICLEFMSDEPQPPRISQVLIGVSGVESVQIARGPGKGGPYELRIGGDSLGNERAANFRMPVNSLLPRIGEEPPRVGRPSRKREAARLAAHEAIQELERIVREMRAVGAFRTEPGPRYEYLGRVEDRLDLVGEHVVSALIEDSARRGKRGDLFAGVNRWLKQVGHVRLLPLRRISKTARLFEVRIKDTETGRWANFAHVGFGIGQAFPVLVEGLRTPPGGTYLVQEPEIHLHPDAQLAMADFLIDLALEGRTVIVETHSEHILLRVRRRLVESHRNGRRGVLTPDDVRIVHVSQDDTGRSHANRLSVDQLGNIGNWPRDFMEEATEERMKLLTARARES